MATENRFAKRRSIYALGSAETVKTKEINHLIEQAVRHAPTAFNSQSARLAVLYGKSYQKLWDITLEALSKLVPWDKMNDTVLKINAFKSGMGTILFFEDQKALAELQQKYPLYAESFPIWAQQSNAMLQYMIWAALAEENIGASLQHYTPLIEEAVRREFGIDESWQMVAQMPFGSIATPAEEKSFLPLEGRIKIFD